MNKEEFFKEFDLQVKLWGQPIAKPKNIEDNCWDFIQHNNIKLDEITKLSDSFSFTNENDIEFVFERNEVTE